MKQKIKLPTILGVIILIMGLISGVFLINSKQVFKLGATASTVPQNVRVSNITNESITITWTTDLETSGFIKWSTTQNTLNKIAIEQNPSKSSVHSATITNLTPNSDIFFKINSESNDYTNNGVAWQAKTLQQISSNLQTIMGAGMILQADASTPANAIVYISINGVLLSTLTSSGGTWVIPVSDFISNLPNTSVVEIIVNGGINGTSQATIYPDAVQSTPTMILGKTYDFRTIDSKNSGSDPKSSLSVPDSITQSSRFEVARTQPSIQDNTVLIESHNEGEIITTTDPEFFGIAPAESQIEILVESELQSGVVSADTKGKWNWSPPNDLEPGEHKVTLKWKDTSGILRTLTRTFIVQAAEGPAFVSTSSATPTNKSTSTPASTLPSKTQSPIVTSQPTPETGDLTPTIGLFIMGIGILMSSIFVYKKSYAEG